jgi:hypothetical protein
VSQASRPRMRWQGRLSVRGQRQRCRSECVSVCAPPARQPATNNMLTPPTSQPQQTRIIYCCNPASPLPSPMPPNRTPATGGAASTCSAAHGTSSVTCHMSHVTCHMSHVTCHMSHVTKVQSVTGLFIIISSSSSSSSISSSSSSSSSSSRGVWLHELAARECKHFSVNEASHRTMCARQ